MKTWLVSVLMVSYNHARYIEEAIRSVLAQEYSDWELIILDDGSSDDSFKIARRYADESRGRIKAFSHPENKNLGIAESYKLGLSLCQGEFVAFLESDDVWLAGNLKKKVKVLSEGLADFVYSDIEPMGDKDVIAKRKWCIDSFPKAPANMPFDAFPELLVANFVPSFSAAVARKELFEGLKFIYHKKNAVWLDWFLWLQVSLRAKFFFLPEKLVSWRLYDKSFCNNFLLAAGDPGLITLECRYRYLIFKDIILKSRVKFSGRLILIYLFIRSIFKKFFIFIYHRIPLKAQN